jgi:cobalt-zinc-cadmium efflux system membrane fusion protein
LAEIESLPLRSLQLELLQARARLDWQSESAQRARALAERNAGALIDLWREETALEVIQQTIQEARMKLKLLGVDSGTLGQWETPRDASPQEMGRLAAPIPLHAPMDGQVEHFEVVPGQVVVPSAPGRIARPEKPLFEIHDRSKLWVCGHVREQDVGNVRVGQKARVSFPAFPERVVTGEVVRVSPVLETNARVLPIWIEIDNADGRLFEGMLARATIDIPTSIKSPQIGGGAR